MTVQDMAAVVAVMVITIMLGFAAGSYYEKREAKYDGLDAALSDLRYRIDHLANRE